MVVQPDQTSLLLFRVGPVLCCAPSLPIISIIPPPKLTRPPGSYQGNPGIFRYDSHIVSAFDLRYKFGVDESQWQDPGHIVITQVDTGYAGFWVDKIIEVIEIPKQGWGALPAHLPRGIFSKTLLFNEKIHLYAEFGLLYTIPDHGYLRSYIEQLTQAETEQTIADKQHTSVNKPTVLNSNPSSETKENKTSSNIPTTDESTTQVKQTQDTPLHQPQQHDKQTTAVTTSTKTSSTDDRTKASVKNDHKLNAKPLTDTTSPSVTTNKPVTPKSLTTPEQTKTEHHSATTPLESTPRINTTKKVYSAEQASTSPAPKQTIRHEQKNTYSSSAQPASNTQSTSARRTTPITSAKANTAVEKPNTKSTSTRQPRQAIPATKSSPTRWPWVILFTFIMLGGLGYFVLLPSTTTKISSNKPRFDVAAYAPPSKQESPLSVNTHIEQDDVVTTEEPRVIDNTNIEPPSTDNIASSETTEPDGYRAQIEKDSEGVTIILHTPTQPEVSDTAIVSPSTSSDSSQQPELTTTPVVEKTTETTNEVTPPPTTSKSLSPINREIIHIVVKGDTLWHIAIRYVNDPFRYPELAKLSKIKNPDLIYPGDRVRIIQQYSAP